MRFLVLTLIVASISGTASAQSTSGPTDPKAQKTYAEALQDLRTRRYFDAVGKFKKANKQDGGHCSECLTHMVSLAQQIGDFKAADEASRDLVALAHSPAEIAQAHYQRGTFLLQQGIAKKKNESLTEADQELKQSMAADPNDVKSVYADGLALSHLKQDEAAKVNFQKVVELTRAGTVDHSRALRLAASPELARERMAPAFAFTAENGQRVSMDELQGKVVLIDFWATWCGPCREALPHMKRIAQKFSGEPLVVMSISLDTDEQKWKNFIAQNEMTWLQFRDTGFEGPIAQLFNVHAIPHTFTIDSDGVLRDENVGDASIEGKLKKLVAQAREVQEVRGAQQASSK